MTTKKPTPLKGEKIVEAWNDAAEKILLDMGGVPEILKGEIPLPNKDI